MQFIPFSALEFASGIECRDNTVSAVQVVLEKQQKIKTQTTLALGQEMGLNAVEVTLLTPL